MTAGPPDRLTSMAWAVGGLSPTPAGARLRFIADLVCPWCYISFRRIERLHRATPFETEWHPFLLNPQLPLEGVPREAYLERKFGSVARADTLYRHVRAVAAREGIRLSFDAIRIQPSTIRAQALVRAAARLGAAATMAAALFRAFFEDGADIGDRGVLAEIARSLGMEEIGTAAADPAMLTEVLLAHEAAGRLGINGVPIMIFGADHVIAGAQPLEALEALLDLERYRLGTLQESGRHAS